MGFRANAMRGGSARVGGVVDHRLARRMLINQVRIGRIGRSEVCDAHPELMRAAEHVGAETSVMCPICDEQPLRIVTYVFGHGLPASGRCVSDAKQLRRLARRAEGDRMAYVVEACTGCRWHHLLRVIPI